MSIKRLLPGRWARILGWALAGVSWGTTAVAVAAGAGDSEAAAPIVPATTDDAVMAPVVSPVVQAPLPDQPASGLVVIRFAPAERPEAQVITRTVTVSAPAASSAPATRQPAATQQPAPVTVQSSGS